jgi:hypothetical protein
VGFGIEGFVDGWVLRFEGVRYVYTLMNSYAL